MEEASQTTKLVTSSLSGFLGSVVSHVTPQAPDSDGSYIDFAFCVLNFLTLIVFLIKLH